MPTTHQISLPLPSPYNCNPHDTFLRYHCTEPTEPLLPSEADLYLSDLCNFLQATKVIQRHPDDFFDIFGPSPKHDARHFDGTLIDEVERDNAFTLCSGFKDLLGQCSSTKDISHLIANGPPPENSVVFAFYEATRNLKLYRDFNGNDKALSQSLGCSIKEDISRSKNPEAIRKKERILDFVLSSGMSMKKKHEVKIMSSAVFDLVRCCATKSNPVNTIINIGEGKGYVSRALSLVHSLQVVGLDCNPAHKEKAIERNEQLVESSCNSALLRGKDGEVPINLYYEVKGHTTSIACTVNSSIDWSNLLRGYCVTENSEGTHYENIESKEPFQSRPSLDGVMEKIKCKVCHRIIRHSTSGLCRHVNIHLKEDNSKIEFITRKEISLWNQTLPPEAFTRKLLETFFETVSFVRLKADEDENLKCLPPSVIIPRGFRIVVVYSTANCFSSCVSVSGETLPAISERVATVLGYDEASRQHLIIFDDSKQTIRVYLRQDFALKGGSISEEMLKCLHTKNFCVVVEILEPSPVLKPPVKVPDLNNAVIIGLHTCGDLGSNICKIFSSSGSRGLLLVSCCWHALTASGFPLSNSLRQHQMEVNKVSLLLATQPFDMWSKANAEGHQSSAKLLFFRSMLKLFWRKLEKEWKCGDKKCGCSFAPLPHLEPGFLRTVARKKDSIDFTEFLSDVLDFYLLRSTFRSSPYTWDTVVCPSCRVKQEEYFKLHLDRGTGKKLEEELYPTFFPLFLGLTVLRMWMCHTIESLLLLDRTIFLHEVSCKSSSSLNTSVSLFPLFDGKISPRMYGICVRRY